jgi:hypothetical protein
MGSSGAISIANFYGSADVVVTVQRGEPGSSPSEQFQELCAVLSVSGRSRGKGRCAVG